MFISFAGTINSQNVFIPKYINTSCKERGVVFINHTLIKKR